jgi:Mrp family chromosome partitioning ATPase
MIVDLDFWRSDLQRLAPSLGLEPTAMRLGPAILMRNPSVRLDAVVCDRARVQDDKPEAVREVLRAVRERRGAYDLILLDAPPLLAIPESLLVATAADAMLLLVRFERTRAATLRLALHKLATVGVVPVGTVLTRVKPRAHRRYGYDELAYGRPA